MTTSLKTPNYSMNPGFCMEQIDVLCFRIQRLQHGMFPKAPGAVEMGLVTAVLDFNNLCILVWQMSRICDLSYSLRSPVLGTGRFQSWQLAIIFASH